MVLSKDSARDSKINLWNYRWEHNSVNMGSTKHFNFDEKKDIPLL